MTFDPVLLIGVLVLVCSRCLVRFGRKNNAPDEATQTAKPSESVTNT